MNIQDHPEYQALKNEIAQQTEESNKALFELLSNVSPERTLSVKDVAEILKVHEVSVRRWIKSGELKAVHFHGYRIDPISFMAFVRNRITEVKNFNEEPSQ